MWAANDHSLHALYMLTLSVASTYNDESPHDFIYRIIRFRGFQNKRRLRAVTSHDRSNYSLCGRRNCNIYFAGPSVLVEEAETE